MKIRYISQEMQSNLLSIEQSVKSIENMYKAMSSGDYVMSGKNKNSHGQIIKIPRKNSDLTNRYISMSGYLGDEFNIAGLKWHGPNLKNSGFAETTYMLILNEVDTGYPVAIMPANLLTTYRTAATSIFAMKLLKKHEFKQIGIVGAGKINRVFLEGIIEKNPEVKMVKIKSRTSGGVEKFISYFSQKYSHISFEAVDLLEDAVKQSDLISLNTGFEYDDIKDIPILRGKWLKQNAIVNSISFFKISDDFLINSAIKVADNFKMYESYIDELGYSAYRSLSSLGNKFIDLVYEKRVVKRDIVDVFDILNKDKIDVLSQDKPIFFASGGMITEDIALGYEILKRAKEQNIGIMLDF